MSGDEDKQRLLSSALIAGGILALLWLIKATEAALGISLASLGILPLKVEGLKGIIFSPLIHGSIAHLVSNSVPLFLLTAALFYYYRSNAWQIFILSWLVTGLWVWLFARGSAYHIGASGVIYALTAFHFVSGIIRKEPKLIAFTLLVTFLYGSFVWGIFPDFALKERISWESHLMGMIAGVVLAWAYKDIGPQHKVYVWPEDEEEADEDYQDESVPGNEDPENRT
ncbi:MAG TPA: rhomboid family intramembrane serine protease [Lentimicrobium sp.]|nr:rhomboid family intramembrane serine protease [Lentimicrobium sp.]